MTLDDGELKTDINRQSKQKHEKELTKETIKHHVVVRCSIVMNRNRFSTVLGTICHQNFVKDSIMNQYVVR